MDPLKIKVTRCRMEQEMTDVDVLNLGHRTDRLQICYSALRKAGMPELEPGRSGVYEVYVVEGGDHERAGKADRSESQEQSRELRAITFIKGERGPLRGFGGLDPELDPVA